MDGCGWQGLRPSSNKCPDCSSPILYEVRSPLEPMPNDTLFKYCSDVDLVTRVDALWEKNRKSGGPFLHELPAEQLRVWFAVLSQLKADVSPEEKSPEPSDGWLIHARERMTEAYKHLRGAVHSVTGYRVDLWELPPHAAIKRLEAGVLLMGESLSMGLRYLEDLDKDIRALGKLSTELVEECAELEANAAPTNGAPSK